MQSTKRGTKITNRTGVHFNWDARHLVVNVGPDAIKYIVEHQVKEIEVVLKNK